MIRASYYNHSKMTIGAGTFWKEINESKEQLTMKNIRKIISTDRPDPCVAIDAFLYFITAYKSCWSQCAKNGNITSFKPIIDSTIGRCCGFDNELRNCGMRTIWCLDGDRGSDKIATERRRLKREGKRFEIFKTYCSIIAMKTEQKAADLATFKRKYILVEENIPKDFDRNDLIDNSMIELENQLATDFKNEGFFPPNLPDQIIEAMKAKMKNICFIRVPEISEGEKLACILTHTGTAQAVYTTDGDSVILGARYIIKSITSNAKCYVAGEYHLFSYARIVKQMSLTYMQLLKFAILLGNDFNSGIHGEGVVTCKKNATSDSFSIVDHNIKNLGCLNLSTCIKELTISKNDYQRVMEELEKY